MGNRVRPRRSTDGVGGLVNRSARYLDLIGQPPAASWLKSARPSPLVSRVFAAGPDGRIDVFEFTSRTKLTSADPGEGLQLVGAFDLGGLEEKGVGSGSLGSAQMNQILVEDGYPYGAASSEGVVVLEIAEGEGDFS